MISAWARIYKPRLGATLLREEIGHVAKIHRLPAIRGQRELLVGDFRAEEEVLDLAVIHGIVAHGHDDPYELRKELRSLLEDMPETKTAVA